MTSSEALELMDGMIREGMMTYGAWYSVYAVASRFEGRKPGRKDLQKYETMLDDLVDAGRLLRAQVYVLPGEDGTPRLSLHCARVMKYCCAPSDMPYRRTDMS